MGKLERFGFKFSDKKDEKIFRSEEERKMAEKIFIEESLEREKKSAKSSAKDRSKTDIAGDTAGKENKATETQLLGLKEDITRGLTEILDKTDKVIKPAQTKVKTPGLNIHGDGYGTIGDMARITTEDKEKIIEIPSKKKDGLKSIISLNSALEKNKKGIDTVSNILEIYKNREGVVVKSEKLRKNISGKIIHIDNDGSVTFSRTNKDGSTQSESFSAEDIIKWKNEGIKADEVLETLKPTESIVKKPVEKVKQNRTEKAAGKKEEWKERRERMLKIFNDKEEVIVKYNDTKNVSARIVRVRNNGGVEVSYKTGKDGRVVDGLFSAEDIIKWKDEGLMAGNVLKTERTIKEVSKKEIEKPTEKPVIVSGAVAKETVPAQATGIIPKKEKNKTIEELRRMQAELQKKKQEKEKPEKLNIENSKPNSKETRFPVNEMPSRAEKETLIRKYFKDKKPANKSSEFGIPKGEKVLGKEAAVTEILSGAGLSGGFGIPKPEKVLEEKKEWPSMGVVEKAAVEMMETKEKESNLVRENYAKTQLDFEKVKQAGGYDPEDFKAKKAPFEGKYNEAKKRYFEFLKNNEGLTNEEKGKFVSEEFNKLQDIKINLRSEEEAKTSHFPFKTIETVGNWYRKQSTKDKYIVAAGLIGGGILAGVAGSAVLASAVGMTAVFSRILSGAGTAVALETAIAQGKGKKFGMHIGHKGLMEERTAEEIEKIKKGITVDSAASFFEKNEGEISAASEKLYKESKNLETQRQLISGAMGALIATGAFGDVMKKAMHGLGIDKAMSNAFNWTKEHLGFGGHEKAAALVGSVSKPEISSGAGTEAHQAALVESENIRNLATIRKGEGITSALERQLEHDPAKFGFNGHDVNNASEVHKWAQKHAYELAVKNGFVSEKGNEILAGTQHVLEKDPLHYGFKGDVKDINKVHEWALHEAHDVAAKTGTDVPAISETRVKWDYSQSADKQAAYVLNPDGKVTEVLSSVKNPHYLYDTSEVIKTQKGLDLVNEQIEKNSAEISDIKKAVKIGGYYKSPDGGYAYGDMHRLDDAIDKTNALLAEKAKLEDQLRFHGEDVVSAQEHVEKIVKKSPESIIGNTHSSSSVPEAEVIGKASDNKIIGSAATVEAGSQEAFGREHLKILKKDWLQRAWTHTSGVKRAMAEDVINARLKGIYYDQELINQLEKSGQGNGQKAALLKKGVLNAVTGLEKQYGKIFK